MSSRARHRAADAPAAGRRLDPLPGNMNAATLQADSFRMAFVAGREHRTLARMPRHRVSHPAPCAKHLHSDDSKGAASCRQAAIRKGRDRTLTWRMIAVGGHTAWFRHAVAAAVEGGARIQVKKDGRLGNT